MNGCANPACIILLNYLKTNHPQQIFETFYFDKISQPKIVSLHVSKHTE